MTCHVMVEILRTKGEMERWRDWAVKHLSAALKLNDVIHEAACWVSPSMMWYEEHSIMFLL